MRKLFLALAAVAALAVAGPAGAATKTINIYGYGFNPNSVTITQGDTVVWVNESSKIYHFAGHKNYGHTKVGAYMCERDATAAGNRAAKDEKRS